MTEQSFTVTGMGCAACAKHVKNAVTGLSGVNRCEVDLEAGKMTVRYDEDLVTFEDMKEVVEEAGYGMAR